jgi:hypothetical protein
MGVTEASLARMSEAEKRRTRRMVEAYFHPERFRIEQKRARLERRPFKLTPGVPGEPERRVRPGGEPFREASVGPLKLTL